MIHCLTSFTSSFFPYEQGNCHLMTEPLRIYLSLYGKLPLPRGMGFSTYAEFTVASGIYHIPRLQGLGIIFTQPAVHIYLSRPDPASVGKICRQAVPQGLSGGTDEPGY